jgi:transposase
MIAVKIYATVRRFVFVEGKSRREAARVFRLSRETIAKMCRYSAPPGYVRSKAPERPKLGPLVPVIDAILDADKKAPPKQRHTAKRIFERLRIEHAFADGYTVVKDYVRLARTRSREVFIPLAHPPARAQIDFGEWHRRHWRPSDEAACLLFRPAAVGCSLHQGIAGGDHGNLPRWARLRIYVLRRRVDFNCTTISKL